MPSTHPTRNSSDSVSSDVITPSEERKNKLSKNQKNTYYLDIVPDTYISQGCSVSIDGYNESAYSSALAAANRATSEEDLYCDVSANDMFRNLPQINLSQISFPQASFVSQQSTQRKKSEERVEYNGPLKAIYHAANSMRIKKKLLEENDAINEIVTPSKADLQEKILKDPIEGHEVKFLTDVENLYSVYEILMPSFDNEHNVRALIHVPLGTPPENGWPVLSHVLGSAFVDHFMSGSPQRAELARLSAQLGIAYCSIEYCVKENIDLLFAKNPEQEIDETIIKPGTLGDHFHELSPENRIRHAVLDVVASIETLKGIESIPGKSESGDIQLNMDFNALMGTSAGGALALAAASAVDCKNLILVAGVVEFNGFPNILTDQVVGPGPDKKNINPNGTLNNLLGDDDAVDFINNGGTFFDIRMIKDKVIPPKSQRAFLYELYKKANLDPDQYIIAIDIDETGEPEKYGHNLTNSDSKVHRTANLMALLAYIEANELQDYVADYIRQHNKDEHLLRVLSSFSQQDLGTEALVDN